MRLKSYAPESIIMKWVVVFHPEFEAEFDALPLEVKREFYAEASFVQMFGPATARPHVDTLKGSKFKNMKELRFEAADGEWRCAFAFDPRRQALMLVAGDKTGDKKFYDRLIAKADKRFAQYLAALEREEKAASVEQGDREKTVKDKDKGKTKGKRR